MEHWASKITDLLLDYPGGFQLPVNHPVVVNVITTILTGICSLVILMVRKKAAKEEEWATLFGFGFLAFAVSYAIQTVQEYMHWGEFWILLVAYLGSSANNLFFLASARSLLGKPARPSYWVIGLAILVTVLGLLDEWWVPVWRLPDAILSIYCLSWIGYATSSNISISRKQGRSWAIWAIVIAGIYCVVQMLIACGPLMLKSHVIGDIVQRMVFKTDLTLLGKVKLEAKCLMLLDRLGIAVLVPLKLGLFLSAFTVLLRSAFTGPLDTLLAGIERGRKEFLTSEGILKSAGQSLGADAVELVYRLPGYNGRRVMVLRWMNESRDIATRKIMRLSAVEDPIIEKVLMYGEEVVGRSGSRHALAGLVISRLEKGVVGRRIAGLFVAVPLLFQGSVVGVIKVESARNSMISKSAISHVRRLAALASLAVQSARELAATDQFSDRFTAWRVAQKTVDFEKGIEKIVEILHDVLSPLATVVDVDAGFQRVRKVAGGGPQAGFLRENAHRCISEIVGELKKRAGDVLEIVEIDLGVTRGDDDLQKGKIQIGKLALVVPAGQDDLSQPTLGANYLLRRTIGALTADAILDVLRDCFGFVLKELAINLNSHDTVNLRQWFDAIQESARKVRLSWVVAENLIDKQSFGDPNWARVVYEHYKPIEDDSSLIQPVIRLDPPVNDIQYIIAVNTRIRMWLGGGQLGIEKWLATSSPWRQFLERFSDIADSAATRLMAEIELQRLQMERAQEQEIAAVAVTTETLFHQLVNMVRDIANPVSAINDALLAKDLDASEENADLIRSTHKASARLLDFAFVMMNVTKLDGHRPCYLLEAARQSQRFFEDGLTRNQITLDIDVSDELVVDVPFHVASLAIANLVTNAKDAIAKRGGNIRIEARDDGDMIGCCVTDNGPGIHQSVRDRLFKIGSTTKKGSGGWGLYLVYRSLIENRGHIELTNPGPGATQFTIRFPKIR